jgi:hypothetical protein
MSSPGRGAQTGNTLGLRSSYRGELPAGVAILTAKLSLPPPRGLYETGARFGSDLTPDNRRHLDELCQAALWRGCADDGVGEAHELMLVAEAALLEYRAVGRRGRRS